MPKVGPNANPNPNPEPKPSLLAVPDPPCPRHALKPKPNLNPYPYPYPYPYPCNQAMGGLSGDSPADSTETDEGEETAEEAQRRQQWIEYYVSIGQYKEAEEIGWDLQYPPDPRQAAGGAEPGPLYAANYAGAAPAKEKKGGGLFGRGKKAEVPAAPQPDTPKGSQMQWLEAGVDAGLKTPSSGTSTGLQTPANAEAGSR